MNWGRGGGGMKAIGVIQGLTNGANVWQKAYLSKSKGP